MSFIRDSAGFEITTGFEGRSALLALHGRLENLAALDLWAALERVIDLRDLRNLGEAVVLDLSELEFIGAAGLLALAHAERSFAEAGVELSLRTPSRLVHRLLATIGPTEVDRLDHALASVGDLGDEQVRESNRPARSSNSAPTTEELGSVTAIPAAPDVVDGVLRLVAELVRVSVSGADGVSVSLLRHGKLLTVAATDAAFMAMDTDQSATGEGPSVDASLQGTCFHARIVGHRRQMAFVHTPGSSSRRYGHFGLAPSPVRGTHRIPHCLCPDRIDSRRGCSTDRQSVCHSGIHDPPRCGCRCRRYAVGPAIQGSPAQPGECRERQGDGLGVREIERRRYVHQSSAPVDQKWGGMTRLGSREHATMRRPTGPPYVLDSSPR